MAEPENAQEFTALYAQNHRRVYAYAVARAGRSLADEVVAETFLVAWRRFAQMPSGAALPWLLGVARNVIRERYRDEERQRVLAAEMLTWAADTPDVADGVAERSAVLTALAALSENDREVLTLIAWDGLSPRAAARVVGCSTPTFLVRLHRARNRLTRAAASAEEPVAPAATPPPARTAPATTAPATTAPATTRPATNPPALREPIR
ncbi:RNA polymerase sigma factor [Actinoplanes sp. DH11]|uniref:RNA polymerase sigma factor n=1 Tax=Actinoplanes sp. DH11 TaxID=2857011 RepID=UPI001E3F1E9A|nr:sigma-70 family RNA polymerase sigma factor [Actinoplanes sp. DH11]